MSAARSARRLPSAAMRYDTTGSRQQQQQPGNRLRDGARRSQQRIKRRVVGGLGRPGIEGKGGGRSLRCAKSRPRDGVLLDFASHQPPLCPPPRPHKKCLLFTNHCKLHTHGPMHRRHPQAMRRRAVRVRGGACNATWTDPRLRRQLRERERHAILLTPCWPQMRPVARLRHGCSTACPKVLLNTHIHTFTHVQIKRPLSPLIASCHQCSRST